MIKEKANKELNDDFGIYKCWNEMIEELSINLKETIDFFDHLTPYEFDWLQELFEDLSFIFKSQEFIDCLYRNQKRTGIDCSMEIDYAIKTMMMDNYDGYPYEISF